MPETKEVVSEEEVELASLIPVEVEDGQDEDEAVELTGEESLEEIKVLLDAERKKVGKRNKSLKKAKDAQHRTQQEKDSIATKIDALEAKLNGVTQSKDSNVETAKLEQEVQVWRDRVADKPEDAIDYANWIAEQNLNRTAAYIQGLEERLTASIEKIRGSTNPLTQKYEAQIATLRGMNPEFAAMTDEVLLPTAKLLGTKVKAPRGTVGGGKVSVPPVKKSKVPVADLEKLYAEMDRRA